MNTPQTPALAPEPVKKKSIVPRLILMAVLLVGGFFLFKEVRFSMTHETTDNAQVEANTVPAIARVAGYVKRVHVKDFARVKAGDTLITIDDQEFRIAVAQAEADLAQAQADLDNARAQVGTISANVDVARANEQASTVRLAKAREDLTRDERLFADRSITRRQVDDSRANLENQQKAVVVTQSQIKATGATRTGAQAQIARAAAQVKARQAALENARLRLSYTVVRAASSGKTGKANLRPGQFINQGATLFTIVDDSDFWVVANFKETQLEHLREGQEVTVALDAYEDEPLKGKIASLSEATGARFSLLPPDNATGNFVKITQRIPVKIQIENGNQLKGRLRAGLSAEVIAENSEEK